MAETSQNPSRSPGLFYMSYKQICGLLRTKLCEHFWCGSFFGSAGLYRNWKMLVAEALQQEFRVY